MYKMCVCGCVCVCVCVCLYVSVHTYGVATSLIRCQNVYCQTE